MMTYSVNNRKEQKNETQTCNQNIKDTRTRQYFLDEKDETSPNQETPLFYYPLSISLGHFCYRDNDRRSQR